MAAKQKEITHNKTQDETERPRDRETEVDRICIQLG
jgi:hypothetical protein